jgi:GBP family porin
LGKRGRQSGESGCKQRQESNKLKELQLNKKLIGVGMLLATNGAFAQSAGTNSIEIYGIVDAAVVNVQNSLNADGNYGNTIQAYNATVASKVPNSVTGLINGGMQGSRFGFRGSEDLGDGAKAFFTLESGFNIEDGATSNAAAALAANSPTASSVVYNSSQDGQLFNRQAFVGLSSATLGSIAFGRQYNTIYDVVANYDPVMQSQTFSPLGASGSIGGGGGISEDVRVDNSIKYKVNIGPVNLGAMYKFGGIAGNGQAGSAYILNAGYEDGPFGIQAVYESFTDALKGSSSTSATAPGINVTLYNSTAYFVAAKYVFGDATVRGGYESYTLKAPSDTLASIGVTSYYGNPIANIASAATSANFTSADQTTDLWFIGGDYNFTPALNLAVGFYDTTPKASSDAKQVDGNIYTYSAVLDYHFSKRTDTYVGYMYSQYKGAEYNTPFLKATAIDNPNNSVFGFGIRHKF